MSIYEIVCEWPEKTDDEIQVKHDALANLHKIINRSEKLLDLL